MSFINKDFHSLPKDASIGEENYDVGYGYLMRVFTLIHSLSNLIHVKTAINDNTEKGIFMLQNEQVKGIKQ